MTSLEPLRLAAAPGATLGVVVSGQMARTITAFASKQELSNSTPSKDLSVESLQKTPPALPQESNNAMSILASNTTATATTIKRNPVGGYVEAAMENYTHIDRPAHIVALTQSMVMERSREQLTANLAATADIAIATTAKRDPVHGLEETATCNYSHIDKPLSLKGARGPQALQDDNSTATTYAQTPTSSDSGNKQQPRAPQVSTTVVPKDYFHTIIRAAHGDKDAQVALGDMYKDGKGAPQDYQAAMDWYLRAAEQGDAVGQRKVGVLYNHGLGVKQNYLTAMNWYIKSADLGNARAKTNIGYFYRHGQGVPLDYSKAMEWYLMAADQGDPVAQCRIGNMYEGGLGVPQHFSQALEWYHKAAEQNHASAQTNIGHSYRDGRGVTQDYAKAMEWLLKSADQGFAQAQYDIGGLYEHGQGVLKDKAMALKCC
ncbi:hypothetical protein BGX30_007349 [Mortierella sp. GBA39]|nr:hypothetical protein BGX30_007349 [Mortierella sp. GBA39]